MNTIVYINGEALDLYPSTVVAITIQRNDFSNLSARSITRTNNIKAPRTTNNLKLTGLPSELASMSTIPYNPQECKIVQNGVEVLSFGYLYVTNVNEKEITIQIYENEINYWDAIEGKKCKDLNYLVNSSFLDYDIDSTFMYSTSGIVSPLINWGKLTTTTFTNGYALFCFYYGQMVQKILEYTGYVPSGSVLTDDEFLKMAIPYANDKWEYPPEFKDRYEFSAYHPTTYSNLGATAIIPCGSLYKQSTTNIFNTSTYHANIYNVGAGASDYIDMAFVASFTATPISYTIGDSVYFKIIRDRGGVLAGLSQYNYVINSASPDEIDLYTTYGPLQDGDKIYMYMEYSGIGFPAIDVSNIRFKGYGSTKIYRAFVFFNYLLPDIPMKEVLQDFVVRFGAIIKTKGNSLIIKTIKELINDKHLAIDWTAKRTTGDTVEFKFNYAKNNWIYHKDIVKNKALGAGNVLLDTNNLSAEKTIYTSLFGNTETSQTLGVNMAQIPVYDSTSTAMTDFKTKPDLRILAIRDRLTNEPNFIFNGNSRNYYKVGYFIDASVPRDAGFATYVNKYYQELIASLRFTKYVTRRYRLSEADIAAFDVHKLVYDNGDYFIVQKINNFVPGKLTTVQLLKVL